MPTFRITAPDGATYRVDAPEGATEAEALERVKAQVAGAGQQPPTPSLSDVLNQYAQPEAPPPKPGVLDRIKETVTQAARGLADAKPSAPAAARAPGEQRGNLRAVRPYVAAEPDTRPVLERPAPEGMAPAPVPMIEQRGAPVPAEVFEAAKSQLAAMPRAQRLAQEQRADLPAWMRDAARAANQALDLEDQGAAATKLPGSTVESRADFLIGQGANAQTAQGIAQRDALRAAPSTPLAQAMPGKPSLLTGEEEAAARAEGEQMQRRSLAARGLFAAQEGLAQGTAGLMATALHAAGDSETAKVYEKVGQAAQVRADAANELQAIRSRAMDSGILPDTPGARLGNYMEGMSAGAMNSVGQMLPGMAGGIAATAATGNPLLGGRVAMSLMTLPVFGQSFIAKREAGGTAAQAAAYAAPMAALEWIGERYGLVPAAMSALRTKAANVPVAELPQWAERAVSALEKRGLFSKPVGELVRTQAGEQIGEQITSAGQYLLDGTAFGLDKPVSLSGFLENARDTAVQTLLATGVMQAGGAAGRAVLDGATGAAGAVARRRDEGAATAAAEQARTDALAKWGGMFAPAPAAPVSAAESPTRAAPQPFVGQQVAREMDEASSGAAQVAQAPDPADDTSPIDASELLGTPLEQAAHSAATSPTNDKPEPSPAQQQAGNYAKGHVRVAGLDIAIENPQGSVRRGVSPDGKAWETPMRSHYGYFKGTKAIDGDAVDVFVKPGTAEDFGGPVFVVDQVDPKTGAFDEHKVVLGAATADEARDLYLQNYEPGWKGVGSITQVPMVAFKSWVRDGKKKQPLGDLGEVKPPEAPATSAPAAAAPAQAAPTAQGPALADLFKNGDTLDLDGQPVRVHEVRAGALIVAGKGGKKRPIAAGSDSMRKLMEQAQGRAPKPVILQNRDRSTPGSIEQMQSIAKAPDYTRLGFSRDFTQGAPVVAGGNIPAAQLGRQDKAAAGDRQIPVRYAVVEAADVLASNRADGTPVKDYATASDRVRAIAGNGRIAGLQAAHRRGKAKAYVQELAADDMHGISPDVIRGMKAPVLVRVMPNEEITPDIGDLSNTTGTLQLSAVEQARNDAQRIDLAGLEFAEDGSFSSDTVSRFVLAMPQAERGALADTNGQPTRQAHDRLAAAVFATAYDSDALIRLYAQAADAEARNVLSALAQAAPSMARLKDAGALDIRPIVTEAAEAAVTARKRGLKLSELAAQVDMAADPDTQVVLQLFAQHARSVRPMAEALQRAADLAYAEATKPAADMFGEVPRATRADVLDQLQGDRREGSRPQGVEDVSGREPAGPDAGGQAAGAGRPADAGQAQAGRPAEEEGLTLTAQTPEDLKAKAEREAAAQERERAKKAAEQERLRKEAEDRDLKHRADQTVDGFQLGQSAEQQMSGMGDMFAEPPATPAPAPAPAPAAKPRRAKSVKSEAGDSEAMRKAKADALAALADIGDILTAGTRKNMLPEQEAKLLPALTRLFDASFRMGYLKFKDAARFVLDTIGEHFGPEAEAAITIEHLQGAYIGMSGRYKDQGAERPAAVVAVESKDEIPPAAQDEEQPEGEDDVPGADAVLERDRQDAGAEAPAVDQGVRGQGSADSTSAALGGARSEGAGRPDGAGLDAGGPPAAGEPGNQPVDRGERAAGPAEFPARSGDGQRSDDPGVRGVPPETVAASQVAGAAVGGLDAARKLKAQREAEAVAVKPGDLENARATLPYLLPGQQEDVHKAETRFAAPDGYGILFTNGTGTGKTFSGLGVVKRFQRQGKANVLIVVPDAKIAADWIESGEPLGLKIVQLKDTKDAGRGIVITTYANLGMNDALATRAWDLVVADEAHTLMQSADGGDTLALDALRAITMHTRGEHTRYTMLNRDDIERAAWLGKEIEANSRIINNPDTMDAMVTDLRAENAKFEAERKTIGERLDAARAAVRKDVADAQGPKRTRAVFLSATPFAYEKTVDWAEGYLFSYDEGQPQDGPSGTAGRGYNSGTNRDRFFVQHFGYRMRYNKLTEPDAKVDRGLMQRQFNGWLRRRGALSARVLDVPADYDRRFVLTESAIGNQIDRAIGWIKEQAKERAKAIKALPDNERGQAVNGFELLHADLDEALFGKLGHLTRRYLLEAIKAKEVIPDVRAHLAKGRKVVVFHDFKKGGSSNPFNFAPKVLPHNAEDGARRMAAGYNEAAQAFAKEFPQLAGGALLQDLIAPIERFKREFPGVLLINGDEKPSALLQRYKHFNDDATGPVVALVQSAKNKGWSGHDTTGKHQRVLFNLGLPTQPTMSIQQEGRIYRTGQVSDALFRYLNTGTTWERWAFAQTIATRSSTAENLGMGEQARALRDAFIAAFEESSPDYRAGFPGEGKGGKERDRQSLEATTEWDRAVAFYWGTQQKTAKTKAQEGADYFATPEPLGLKMVQWADPRGGESALEPSGGHGAIARWLGDTLERTVIEPSDVLGSKLALVYDGKIVRGNFEDYHIVNKHDVVTMNPPFGVGGKTAVEHLAKAAQHTRDGGRIVALIPTGPAADKRFEKWFYGTEQRALKPLMEHPTLGPIYRGDVIKTRASFMPLGRVTRRDAMGALWLKVDGKSSETMVPPTAFESIEQRGPRTEEYRPAEGLHLVGEVLLPNVTFERAGTQVATRIVIIDKAAEQAAPFKRIDLTGISDIRELFKRLEGLEFPKRAKSAEAEPEAPAPREERQAAKAAAAAVGGSAAQAAGLPVVKHVTGKGKTLEGVVLKHITPKQAEPTAPFSFKKDGGTFVRLKDLEATLKAHPLPGAPLSMPTLSRVERPRRMTREEASAAGYARAYRGVSLSTPFNDSGTAWLTTNRDVAQSYAEEVMGYEDPGVMEVWYDPKAVPTYDMRRISDDERDALDPDVYGNPQKPGIYLNSDDDMLGARHTVIHAPASALAVVNDGGAVFSRGKSAPPAGAPVEQLQAAVTSITSEWAREPDAPRVHVVATAFDLPDDALNALYSLGAADEARGLRMSDGRVYLVADKLQSVAEGQFVLFHEAYGHHGLRALLGKAYGREMMLLRQANPKLRSEADAWFAKYGEATIEAAMDRGLTREQAELRVRALATEEALADRAGNDTPPSGWKSFMARLQRALRRLKLDGAADFLESMTEAETWALLRDARRLVREGRAHAYTAPARPASARQAAAASRSTPQLSRAPAATAGAAPRPTLKPSTGPLDRAVRLATGGARPGRFLSASLDTAIGAVDRALSVFGDAYEYAKAGLVDRYGVPEAHSEAKTAMRTRIRQNARKTGEIVDKLRALDRQQSRIAYLWMSDQTADSAAERALMATLPEEPRQVLEQLKRDIDALSQEAVQLGLMTQETYERNAMAYLHRSYERFEKTDDGAKVARARAIKLLGDQFKGRGLRDDAAPAQIATQDWWQRKMREGRADTSLKGAKFFRLELRKTPDTQTPDMVGGERPRLGKLQKVLYWPVSDPIPRHLADWRNDGVWEARFFDKGEKVGMWRDFTLAERTAMGEIQEVKFSIAKTMMQMVRDVETARFLDWVARNESKLDESQLPEGAKIVAATERLTRSFLKTEWVQVPASTIPGTSGLKRYGRLGGRFVPGPVWNDLRQIGSLTDQGDLADLYQRMLRAWKVSKTALSPVTHTNNLMANFVLADMHDVQARHILMALRTWASHKKDTGAAQLLAAYQDNGGDAGMFNEHEINEELFKPLVQELELAVEQQTGTALVTAAQVLDLLHARQFRQAFAALGRTKAAGALAWAPKKMIKLYGLEDEVFRLAAFVKAREDGLSDQAAGKFARDSFLNYDITAPWVNALRRSVLPFAAFTYRAVPMVVKTMAEKPHKAAKYWLLATALNSLGYLMVSGDDDQEEQERALLPDEKAGKVWGITPKLIRMPWNDDHGAPVFLDVRRWVPLGDVVDFGQSQSAVPLPPPLMPGGPAVILGEVVLNHSAFTGKELTLSTDTLGEKYGKVADHLWKGFMPNFPGIPGTYSSTALMNAGSGKTDVFGREQSLPQAAASSLGLKLASYPRDVLARNAAAKAKAEIAEIQAGVRADARQLARKGIDADEFAERQAAALEKMQRISGELQKKTEAAGAGR